MNATTFLKGWLSRQRQTLLRWVCILLVFTITTGPLTACGQAQERDGQADAANLLAISMTQVIGDGVVYATGVGTNVWALYKALTNAPNTFIIMDAAKQYAIFAVPTAQVQPGVYSWWFAMVDCKKIQMTSSALEQLPTLGNMANAATFSGLVNRADALGWKVTTPDQLPWPFKIALLSAVKWLATSCSQNLTDFMAVPAGALQNWQEPLIDYLPTDS